MELLTVKMDYMMYVLAVMMFPLVLQSFVLEQKVKAMINLIRMKGGHMLVSILDMELLLKLA